MNYINLLEDFDGSEVGEIAVGSELYEEAFVIFKVFDLNVQAVSVLLDNIRSIDRAVQFAARAKQNEVWSQVGKAQLREGLVGDAIESFIKADDATQFNEVINETSKIRAYEDMLKYLLMARKKGYQQKVDSMLIYAYAKMDRLRDLEELIVTPNVAHLPEVGGHLFDEALYEAAKIIFTHIGSWAKLASTLVKLHQFQAAVDAAHKANSSRTWKEVCFACFAAKDLRLAQICGLKAVFVRTDSNGVVDLFEGKII